MKVPHQAISTRLSGLSGFGFGASWIPPVDRHAIVRALTVFLEDRRALYQSHYREYSPWVVESILEIRQELTSTIQKLPDGSSAIPHLQQMRAACRKFLDQNADSAEVGSSGDGQVWVSLGELRGVFGLHLAVLTGAFQIDVEEQLAAIMPVGDEA